MRNHARILAVALALSASGCSLMVDPAKNDPLASAEGFCNSVQDVISKLDCDVFYQSGGRADPTAADQVLTSLRTSCDNLNAAVDAGRFTYDASAAQGCIDALESVGCKGIFAGMSGPAFPALCARAVKGSVAPGGSCLGWNTYQGGTGFALNECTQGSTCRYGDYNVCQSTCGFDSDVGGPCGRGNQYCKPNLFCNYNDFKCYAYVYPSGACDHSAYKFCDPDSSYCTAATGPGTCAYLPSSGACRTTGSNIWGYTCSSSYYCNAGTCTYRPYPGSAATCTSAPCQSGSYCDGTKCQYYVSEGGNCGAGAQCAYPPNGTSVPLYCDSGSTCRRYPATRLGQGSDCFNLGSAYCADGLFCDYANVLGQGANTCQPQQTSGLCPTYDMCAPGTECRYVNAQANNFCVPLGRLGDACDSSTGPTCLQGTWCKTPGSTITAGTCALLPGASEACATNGMQSCAFGTRPDYGTSCTCRSFLGEGEPCTGDWECGGTMTGRKCVSNFCQPFPCFTPVGWLAGSSGGT